MKRVICFILTALFFVTTLVGCSKNKIPTEDLAIYSENTAITKGMLQYSFNVKYKVFLQSYKDNLQILGLDTKKSLAEQECGIDASSATWYDYFMNATKEQFMGYAVLKEYMIKKGDKLDSKYNDRQNEILAAYEESAKVEDKPLENYIKDTYGENVTEEDIINVIELEAIEKMYYDKFLLTLDDDDKALKAYYDGHQKKYSTIDYLVFTIPAPTENDVMKTSNTRAFADNLSAQYTKRNFLKKVGEYVEEYLSKTENLDEDELDKRVAAAKNECIRSGAYYDDSTFMRWAFYDKRKVGDGLVQETEDGGYNVYLLTKLPKIEKYNLVNLRQIQLEITDKKPSKKVKKQAKKLLEKLKENGFSKDSFITLAAEHSADALTNQNGGLYENLIKGQIKNAEEVEEWVFDKERAVGDNTIIKSDEYGWHILYIEEIGDEYWKYASKTDFQNSAWNEHLTLLGDEYMIYSNGNVINQVNEVSVK